MTSSRTDIVLAISHLRAASKLAADCLGETSAQSLIHIANGLQEVLNSLDDIDDSPWPPR